MYIVLIVIAVLIAGYGFLSLSQATMGAGLIATACLVGILARIAQAHEYQHAGDRPARPLRFSRGQTPEETPEELSAPPAVPTIAVVNGQIRCPECRTVNSATRTSCEACGAPFPFESRRIVSEGAAGR